jgi:hypothetical protein
MIHGYALKQMIKKAVVLSGGALRIGVGISASALLLLGLTVLTKMLNAKKKPK